MNSAGEERVCMSATPYRQADWWFENESGNTQIRHEKSDDDLFSSRMTTPPAIDERLNDQIQSALFVVGYEVEERLDDHTNSHVYRARRLSTGAAVAVKVLVEHPQDISSAVRRFRQEARLMTTLHHPNLVRALAHGCLHGVHYAILELAEGRNLRSVVQADGPLSIERAANVAWQTANVLEYLHQRGVIHRDVKPSNLVQCNDGRVKLLDLGLARAPVPDDTSITLLFDDRLLGTPDFMAPEQALECHLVDARADLYALGCTLYYLLSGRPPIPGRNLLQSLLGHQNAQPTPVSTLRPDVPAELQELCAKLMAKSPCDRYETAAEVADRLARWGIQ